MLEVSFDYDLDELEGHHDMGNKLFCTFSSEDKLEETLSKIKERYKIIYNKIFVLHSEDQDEYICTYNVDLSNVSSFLDNTILVHRKKETNTLYTINALNIVIKELNEGVLDTSFILNWGNYKNCILLTKGAELRRVNTKLYKIVSLED